VGERVIVIHFGYVFGHEHFVAIVDVVNDDIAVCLV
jgi:hypothetical protein